MNTIKDLYDYANTPKEQEIEYFKQTFIKYGSDKSRPHTYDLIYSALFENRENVKNVIEMGIAGGSGLRSFSEMFKNANIYGMDIVDHFLFNDDRIKTFWADQNDGFSMIKAKEKIGNVEFDLIIDDGCHELLQTVNTFQTMLPWLSVNGWFVVEDIKIPHETNWEGIAKALPDNYESFLIPMNQGVYDIQSGLQMSDNTVLVVHRKS